MLPGLMELKEPEAHLDKSAILVPAEIPVFKVALDSRDLADRMDRLELADLLDQLVELDGLVHQAKLDLPDFRDQLANQDSRETLVDLVTEDSRDLLEILESQVLQEVREEREMLVSKVREVVRARMELRVLVEETEHQEHQVGSYNNSCCLY